MNLDSLLTGENASFVEEMYLQWQQDPTSVESQWSNVFEQWENERGVGFALLYLLQRQSFKRVVALLR